jgi:rod shape determining protein RodA
MATTSPPIHRSRHVVRVAVRSLAGKFDWVLGGAVALVVIFGLRMVALATRDDIPGDPGFFATRQLMYVVLGVGVMAAAIATDAEAIGRRVWTLWGALIGAVSVVLVIGSSAKGAARWIDFGIFQFQPSEVGKVAMIVILAGLCVERADQVGTVRFSLLAIGVTLVPTFIVFIQPDLGTSLVYVAICAAMLYFAGTPTRQFKWAAMGGVAVVAMVLWILPAVGMPVLQDYQMARLTTFIDSSKDPGSNGWQVNQSRIAVGHGGAFGRGLEGSTQVQNDLLPEHQTDFIFASAAEMLGFVGMVALILVFGVILWRVLRIAKRAATPFDQLVAGGIAAMLGFQMFVNIGMNVAIMPVAGIPLPFMSYGGTHTLTNFIAVGMLMRIHRRSARLVRK